MNRNGASSIDESPLPPKRISALPPCLRPAIVLFARFGYQAVLALDAFLLRSGMTVVEVSPLIADIAFAAFRRFGKGTATEQP